MSTPCAAGGHFPIFTIDPSEFNGVFIYIYDLLNLAYDMGIRKAQYRSSFRFQRNGISNVYAYSSLWDSSMSEIP